MKILDRYLAGAVVRGTLVTLGVLLPLLGFFLFADEMDEVGENGYRLGDALLFVVLTMPRYVYQVFPIATLIGALVGLGSLASRSELIAIRAAGVSVGRILYAALKGGALMALAALVVGEGVAPIAEQKALQWRSEIQSGQVTLKSEYGFWALDGGAYIYIREILSGEELRDIRIYEFDGEQRLTRATRAEQAQYTEEGWVLQEISRSMIGDERVEARHDDRADWDLLLNPRLLKIVVVDPHVLSVWEVLRYVRYMAENNQDSRPYEVVFWGRVVHPFLILTMIFVSIPVLLGSTRSGSLSLHIFSGVVVGMVFYLISRTFAYAALLYGMNPLMAALIPPLVFLLVAFQVLRKL